MNKIKDRILKATRKWPDPVSFVKDSADVKLPLRINFAGGWTDTSPYCLDRGGAVLNAPILIHDQKPVHARVERLDAYKIIIESKDLDERKEFWNWDELLTCDDPEDPFSLSKAALIVCGITPADRISSESLQEKLKKLGGGIYLNTEVIDVPKGSGLGTSSILGAAILECFGCLYTKEQLIQWVLCMEQLMSTGGGWQNQAGALSDGLCLITSQPGDEQNLRFDKVQVSDEVITELEDRLVLVFTGQKRLARNLLRSIMGRHINGEIEAEAILERFKKLAYAMKRSLELGDFFSFAEEMNEHWNLLKRLDPESANPKIEEMLDALKDLIAGCMICGAGGGGYLQILLKPGVTKESVEERLDTIYQNNKTAVSRVKFVYSIKQI